MWAKRAKIGSEIMFLPFSQVWFISFPLNCNSLEHCLTS